MFYKIGNKVIELSVPEKTFLELPYCSCTSCKQIQDSLKEKISKKKFKKLDAMRMQKIMR